MTRLILLNMHFQNLLHHWVQSQASFSVLDTQSQTSEKQLAVDDVSVVLMWVSDLPRRVGDWTILHVWSWHQSNPIDAKWPSAHCSFRVSRIESLCSPASRKRRVMEASGESLRPKNYLGQHAKWPSPAGTLKDHHHHHQPYSILTTFKRLYINHFWRYLVTCADVA